MVEELVYFRKSSLVSLDQLFLGDAKGEAPPPAGITRYVGSIYTGRSLLTLAEKVTNSLSTSVSLKMAERCEA